MSKESHNAFLVDIMSRKLSACQIKPEQWSYETALVVATTQAYITIPAPYCQNPLIRLLAVQRNPWQIERIPEEERDYELYRAALVKDAGILKIIPPKFRTEEIYMIASCSNQLKDAYPYLPKSYRKQKALALAAVSESGKNIAYVPRETLDEEICRAAVISFPLALEKVPPDLRSYELCLSAIAKTALVLPCIPTKFLNEEIFSFVYQNPEVHRDETIVGDLPRWVHIRWAEWQLRQQAR